MNGFEKAIRALEQMLQNLYRKVEDLGRRLDRLQNDPARAGAGGGGLSLGLVAFIGVTTSAIAQSNGNTVQGGSVKLAKLVGSGPPWTFTATGDTLTAANCLLTGGSIPAGTRCGGVIVNRVACIFWAECPGGNAPAPAAAAPVVAQTNAVMVDQQGNQVATQ